MTATTDDRGNEAIYTNVADSITDFALSPDGKEIAFIDRGEVFVTAVDHDATTRRLTDTPEQERSVSFSPDGRGLLYASERRRQLEPLPHRSGRDDEPDFFGRHR